MAGIYLHIPFCKTFCNYCDFYSITDHDLLDDFTGAVIKEAAIQSDYLSGEKVNTIYFGGGTPSLMPPEVIGRILKSLGSLYSISDKPEVTIEVNPDDVRPGYFSSLIANGVNRISIGVQSWNDVRLKYLGRRHSARQSEEALKLAFDEGVRNVSVDLIYGIPGMTAEDLRNDLEKTFSFPVKHLSAYHLTVEEDTRFGKMKKQGKLNEVGEEESIAMFTMLSSECAKRGFLHYEISNFAADGFLSQHNSAYWKQTPYLGLGPSAHSFNQYSRQWNVSNVIKYLSSIKKGEIPCEREELDAVTMFNEYVMTSLRTMWGIDLSYVEEMFSKEMSDYLINVSDRFVNYGLISCDKKTLVLTDQGKMISDNIITELLMER